MQLFPARLPAVDLTRLADHLGRRPRPLAWARAASGVVVALHDRLCLPEGPGWRDVPWHDILSGGWDDEARMLRWSRVSSAERESVELLEARSLPEVFRERVEATFLFQQAVYPREGKAVTITARRSLAEGDQPVVWTAHPARGVRMDAETVAFTEAELARLRAEYAF